MPAFPVFAQRCLGLWGLLVCWGAVGPAASWGAPPVDFNRDIRPILSAHCYQCHGPDANHRQGNLRLDERASALHTAASGETAITPGDVKNSELISRIHASDPDTLMPPPAAKKPLSEAQKSLLRAWIEQGAPYAAHWSFVAPVKAALPKVSRSDWGQQEIDRFVLARLEQEGLTPSPSADRYQLIRRLSLDLTGLPPTPEEVLAYQQDTDPRATEKVVDRLLASPHFGERMALEWLDAARYADTNGFSIDGGRHLWLWRDWVIQAFNQNLPYDQFLVEQLAGDLLPNPTTSQLIATGFQRNNMVTHEGGTIPAENLTNYNADRVKTLGEAVLGLTLGCAQCHDHKYDAISQKDYYRLFAYFNTVSDIGLDGNSGVNPRPVLQAKTVLQTGEEPHIQAELERLQKVLAEPDPALFAKWEVQQREELAVRGQDLQLLPMELLNVSTPNRGAGFELAQEENGQQFVRITQASSLVAYDISTKLPETAAPITGVRVVFHPDPAMSGGGWGYGGVPPVKKGEQPPMPAPKGTFRLTAFSASADAVPGDQVNLPRLLPIAQVTAKSWEEPHLPKNCLDPRNDSGWSPDLADEGAVHLTVTFAEPLSSQELPYLTVQLNFGSGQNLVAAKMELLAVTGHDDGSPLPTALVAILQKPTEQRTAEEGQALRSYFSQRAEVMEPVRVQIANLTERLAVLTQEFPTMVMDVAAQPRPTFLLHRGDYSQPREEVTAGTLSALPTLPEGASPDRLGLAKWLIMRENPLTARVAVNRLWQMVFGRGIVATPADFGAQGEWPSHPELLDWLAVDFVESGWDVKRLLKMMVLSSTYQQTSAVNASLGEQDPENRLLARGPRFRLSAEIIRDQALTLSGLLVPRLGGPSVNPYTPGDLWREVSHYGSTPATSQTFVQDHGEKLYRRSLYTYWKRTVPPPNMAAFDAPNRETCVVSRPVTNTPLQALVLLNDVQFVEAARAFAQRIIQQPGGDPDKLKWAVLAAFARPASDAEIQQLQKTLDRERRHYQHDPAAAEAFLANGESPRDEAVSPVEHAAWSQVALLLMNLSESVTRN